MSPPPQGAAALGHSRKGPAQYAGRPGAGCDGSAVPAHTEPNRHLQQGGFLKRGSGSSEGAAATLRRPPGASLLTAGLFASLLLTSPFAASVAAAAQALGCEGAWADSPICRERQEALDGRARLEALREQLAQVPNPPWDAAALAQAEALYQEGMRLYGEEYFGDAAEKFAQAQARMQAIDAQFQELKETGLATGQALLEAGDFAAAAAEFQALANWLPDAAQVEAGLAAARQGAQAQALLEQANRLIDQGDAEAAASKLQELPPGALSEAAAKAQARIAALGAQARFKRLMSEGFRRLDQGQWAEAERAFGDALALNPNARAAQEALEDVRRRQADAALAGLAEQLEGLLEAENWAAAQTLLEAMQAHAPDRAGTAETLAQVTRLAETEQRIDSHLAKPAETSGKAAREAIRALLAATRDSKAQGVRIAAKRALLERQLALWTTPMRLSLRSDGRTEVRIAPGRALGKFQKRELQVFPGRYVLRGHRSGFREVRMELDIAPATPALAVEIRCHERF